jgi:hypothetical protein
LILGELKLSLENGVTRLNERLNGLKFQSQLSFVGINQTVFVAIEYPKLDLYKLRKMVSGGPIEPGNKFNPSIIFGGLLVE